MRYGLPDPDDAIGRGGGKPDFVGAERDSKNPVSCPRRVNPRLLDAE